MASKGFSMVCSGVGMFCGMGAIGGVGVVVVVGLLLVRFAYEDGVCFRRSVFFMYSCHEGCTSVVFGV
jgi:hypothetical protein